MQRTPLFRLAFRREHREETVMHGARRGWPNALLLSALAALLLSACADRQAALEPKEAREQLVDRNWIDRWPTTKHQRLHVLRFVPSMGGGVYHDRTLFRGKFELFTFEATGREIRFVFPHSNTKAHSRYTIEPVDGPEPFTHKLSLPNSPRGPKVYYGFEEGGHTAKLLGLAL